MAKAAPNRLKALTLYGTPVGYIVVDTSTAVDNGVKELGKVVYVYDPKTYLISAFYSTSPTLEIGMTIGDYNDPSNEVVNPLTGAASTSATPATTAAASSGSDLGPYPGSAPLTLPDAVVKQFESSVGSSVKNQETAAFVSPDSADKIKAYYLDALKKNGRADLSAQAGADLSQLEGTGAFGLVYNKGDQVVVLIGLPAASASSLGLTNTPSSGTLVLGFTGQA